GDHSARVVAVPRTGRDDHFLARRAAVHGGPDSSAFLSRSLRIRDASRRSGWARNWPISAAVNGWKVDGRCCWSKRHNIQFTTSAKSAFDSGEVATPGTRPRYSRPPETRTNFATVPARPGAVPALPVPSTRWHPRQFIVQFCQARRGSPTPAGAAPAVAAPPGVCAAAPCIIDSAAAIRSARAGNLLLLNSRAQDDGDRARVGLALGAETPRNLIVGLRPHQRPIAAIVLAGASTPGDSAA